MPPTNPASPRTTTVDGYETTFAVNHLGHALLVGRLEDRVVAERAEPGRGRGLGGAPPLARRSRLRRPDARDVAPSGPDSPTAAPSWRTSSSRAQLARRLARTVWTCRRGAPGRRRHAHDAGQLRAPGDAAPVPTPAALPVHLTRGRGSRGVCASPSTRSSRGRPATTSSWVCRRNRPNRHATTTQLWSYTEGRVEMS